MGSQSHPRRPGSTERGLCGRQERRGVSDRLPYQPPPHRLHPTRSRKLLLHAAEINKLIGKTERAGFTLVPLDMHYSKGRIKLEIGLAKGKKQHDKRAAEKEREWQREKQRLVRTT